MKYLVIDAISVAGLIAIGIAALWFAGIIGKPMD